MSDELQGDPSREFTRELLRDLQALRTMIAEDRIESDVARIGAEQELFLVDGDWLPAPVSDRVLEGLDPQRFTTELGRFNVEINLDPLRLGGDCLTRLDGQLRARLDEAQAAATEAGASLVMTGILPTLTREHASLEYMTPKARYRGLNDRMSRLRGGPYDVRIKGRDELISRHDNVMLEACNTSFQIHLQVGAPEFAVQYNIAQLIAGPVLASMANSPLLFDRQLWSETRIALFQQATDERSQHLTQVRSHPPRVSFGGRWLRRSAVEAFEEDIARFRPIFEDSLGEDAIEVLKRGGVPELRALKCHNGTVYRWNRPCYGVSEGRPHLRIECRYVPSGPTVADEVANTALWLGLMHAMREECGDPAERLAFGVARSNFLVAARNGLGANFQWIDGQEYAARALLIDRLLPLAREGLRARGCDEGDVDRFLGVIEHRVVSGKTGSWWLTRSHDALAGMDTAASRNATLVRELHAMQSTGEPVHTWEPVRSGHRSLRYCATVEQLMSTDLFTVRPDELIHLAAHVMDWRHVRHVPVEDEAHRLVGLISHRQLLRTMATQAMSGTAPTTLAREVMCTDIHTVGPRTSTRDALELMRREEVSCLPVVCEDGRLVGILTERDFMRVAAPLLREFLGDAGDPPEP